MSVQTVTVTVGTTCNYWALPQANLDTAGSTGITVPGILSGVLFGTASAPLVLTLSLDNAYLWDIYLDFLNAEAIELKSFNPLTGGDLLALAASQGWAP